MIINPNKIPSNLDDAVIELRQKLISINIKELQDPAFCPEQWHFTIGTAIRNQWKLWDKNTPLVKWFKSKYDIDHADDISKLILNCLYRDANDKPRRTKDYALKCINHWKLMEFNDISNVKYTFGKTDASIRLEKLLDGNPAARRKISTLLSKYTNRLLLLTQAKDIDTVNLCLSLLKEHAIQCINSKENISDEIKSYTKNIIIMRYRAYQNGFSQVSDMMKQLS